MFNPSTSLSCNVHTSSSLDIIARHVLDLGIYVSSDCFFEFHITNLNKNNETFNWLDTENFLLSRQIDNVDLV